MFHNVLHSKICMQVVQRLLEGDIFGDIGVLCNRPQPFTVRTTELSQILRLNKTSLTDIIQANKADGDIIMSHLFLVMFPFIDLSNGSGGSGYNKLLWGSVNSGLLFSGLVYKCLLMTQNLRV